MSRTPNTPATPVDMPELMPAKVDEIVAMQDAAQSVTKLAAQIGYEGSLTVGALEDEIRFYQRRTVEAILETGKRLLLLKEMTPHGDFAKRAEMLGFHIKTAQRFMQAALKTAKSDKLSFLAGQVKSGSAFLELITHDDEELKVLDGMDDVDRMGASQLRAAFRKSEADRKRNKAVIEEISSELMDLRLQCKKLSRAPASEQHKALKAEASGVATEARALIFGPLTQAVELLTGTHNDSLYAAALVGELQRELTLLRDAFGLPDVSSAQELQQAADVAEWGNDSTAA